MVASGVVVGFDGSPTCIAALDLALQEAASRGVGVTVVSALSPSALRREQGGPAAAARRATLVVEAALAAVREADPDGRGVEVDLQVREGDPCPAILAAARGHELLVLGAVGGWREEGTVLGGTARGCLQVPPCPVVVVRGTTVPVPPVKRVVLGLEPGGPVPPALTWAWAEARRRGCELVVVAAWSRGDVLDRSAEGPELDRAEAVRARAAGVLRAAGVDAERDVELRVRRGRPEWALREAALSADLLVLGTRGHLSGFRYGLPSTGAELLATVSCPVVLVPARAGA